MTPDVVRPARVLLVEDNPGDVVLTVEAFEDARVAVDVIVREDGSAALEFLVAAAAGDEGAAVPDIVLLDLNLPGVNGLELLDHIRSEPALAHLPVILLTSTDAPDAILAAYRSRASSFITKPVDPQEFLRAIRTLERYWLTVVRVPGR